MNDTESQPQDMKQYYILGIVVLVAIVVAGYMLRPKTESPATSPTTSPVVVVPTPTPGPITKLACDLQYFNPRIGFAEYYLSVDGGDVSTAKTVDCTFTASASGKQVASANVTSPLTAAPQRGGSTFRCTTKAISLAPSVPTTVDIALKDDLGATSTCSGVFTFPAP